MHYLYNSRLHATQTKHGLISSRQTTPPAARDYVRISPIRPRPSNATTTATPSTPVNPELTAVADVIKAIVANPDTFDIHEPRGSTRLSLLYAATPPDCPFDEDPPSKSKPDSGRPRLNRQFLDKPKHDCKNELQI